MGARRSVLQLLRSQWWRWRRQAAAWLLDHYSDGSTIINVWLHEWRAVVPRRLPWWLRWMR